MRIQIREAVGFSGVLPIVDDDGNIVDITDWEFALTLTRQAGTVDITVEMAADANSDGFWVLEGAAGQLQMIIPPGDFTGIDDTTGLFELFGDLLATRPTGDFELVDDLTLVVTSGPTTPPAP